MSTLSIADAERRFRSGGGVITALDGVALTVEQGEIVGLVGESGCGKSTLARIASGLDSPDRGEARYGERPMSPNRAQIDADTRRRVQLVFQDPLASFNPRRSVGRSIALPLRLNGLLPGGQERSVVAELMNHVGLDAALMDRKPHKLSGGQLQRSAIARALGLAPDILICDEPVASLDVSVRAQILNLLLDLRRERGIGILFVSHDLGVVRRIADRVVVMYLGRIVEEGTNEAVWSAPRHPYTKALAASVPTGASSWRRDGGSKLEGEPPSPFDIPPGCRFHPRCPIAVERCRSDDQELRRITADIQAACHLAK
ncbi:MAG: oligopeptide/dipeptide ABC transporter ATP-binding protein [Pseudomonadota bacterium]